MESNQKVEVEVEVDPVIRGRKASLKDDIIKKAEALQHEREKKEEVKHVVQETILTEIEQAAKKKRELLDAQEKTREQLLHGVLEKLPKHECHHEEKHECKHDH